MDSISAPQLHSAELAMGMDRANLNDGGDSFPVVDNGYHEVEIIPYFGA